MPEVPAVVRALIGWLVAAALVVGPVYLSYQAPRWSNAIMAGWTALAAIVALGGPPGGGAQEKQVVNRMFLVHRPPAVVVGQVVRTV
ncbi:hypothetical protein ACK8N7_36565 [Streptomyces griseobrunneus]